MKKIIMIVLVSVFVVHEKLPARPNVDHNLLYNGGHHTTHDHFPVLAYTTVHQRVKELERDVPLHFNSLVKGFIDYFTVRDRDYIRRVIGRSRMYFPIIEDHLAKHGLPDELKYLAIVESALYPVNKSPMGAVGLWQLMKPTAREFGLEINDHVDERLDPHKSTEAACQLLKWLYESYGNWELALAAYNFGSGNVNKAIRKAGEKSFWSIYDHLPLETRSYLPQYVAFTYIMNHLEAHNLYDIDYEPIETRELKVYDRLDLKELSGNMKVDIEDLKALNPHLIKNHIPKNDYGVKLVIPHNHLTGVLLLYAKILEPVDLEIFQPDHDSSIEKYIAEVRDSLWKYDNIMDEPEKDIQIQDIMTIPEQEVIFAKN